jgi:hypothetical protein
MSGIGAAKQTGASAVTLRRDGPAMGMMIRAIRLVGYVAGWRAVGATTRDRLNEAR